MANDIGVDKSDTFFGFLPPSTYQRWHALPLVPPLLSWLNVQTLCVTPH